MRQMQEQVATFHRAFGLPAPTTPQSLDTLNGDLRCALIREETEEFCAAWSARDPIAMIDALCDIAYVVAGSAVEMGIDLSPFFDEVHESNMRKVGGGIREDGKYLKPAGWLPPGLDRIYGEMYGTPSLPGTSSPRS